MNIAIIVDRFPQLSETFVLHQIVGLKSENHLVHIYPITKGLGLNIHPEVALYKLMSNTFYPPSVPKFSLFGRFKFLGLLLKHHKFHPVFNRLRKMSYFQHQPFGTRLSMLSILIPFLHNIKYDIVGDGELLGVLQELVNKLNISDNVIFHGPKDKTEILKFYRKADVFILPSVTASDGNTEGQGLVLQEAQAMEIPVISTVHNGIPEGVKEGITGFLVPERNSEAIAEKLSLLIEDTELRKKMGKDGRRFIIEKFDNKKLNRQLINLYQKMMSSKDMN